MYDKPHTSLPHQSLSVTYQEFVKGQTQFIHPTIPVFHLPFPFMALFPSFLFSPFPSVFFLFTGFSCRARTTASTSMPLELFFLKDTTDQLTVYVGMWAELISILQLTISNYKKNTWAKNDLLVDLFSQCFLL